MLEQLNNTFAIPDHVIFQTGAGDRPVAVLQNQYGQATISIYGGHVLTYTPNGQTPVLWVSKHAKYENGIAIRGGVPIIFPWFGSHPSDSTKPSHGFARRTDWHVQHTNQHANGSTEICLALTPTEFTQSLWAHDFVLQVTVILGAKLEIAMIWQNLSDTPMSVTNALHTYFAVADSTQVTIKGLENIPYLDQLAAMQRQQSAKPIQISAEVDRIYLESAAQIEIIDPGLARTIHITKQGSQSTVVWNPWIAKSARMSDFGDLEYREMVCVEAANIDDATVTLAPNDSHETRQIISVSPLNAG